MSPTHPKILTLKGKKSCLHIEVPHGTQATTAEFLQMVDHVLRTDASVKRKHILANHTGMSLMWRDNHLKFSENGLHVIRNSDSENALRCHPKDKEAVTQLIISYLSHAYDAGTLELGEVLNKKLKVPVLVDGQHRYVGGDLNRSSGTPNLYGAGNNSAKWVEWQKKENLLLNEAKSGVHVAVALHSMDKKPHRRFINEATGKYEYDREIIIGTRFGTSVNPEILKTFYFVFENALHENFKGKVPRVKLDVEYIGDKVLKERRQKHVSEGRDVHYIQMEFMKYLLQGASFKKIAASLAEALEKLDQMLMKSDLVVPLYREQFNAEYEGWRERVEAKSWDFSVLMEEDKNAGVPYVRLSAIQREYLRVELYDTIEDSEGREWVVKNQHLENARPYTEKDLITICG
ncbi:MAG: hypothetical protein AAB802_01905, partial [Patescibacteria group bacterium]